MPQVTAAMVGTAQSQSRHCNPRLAVPFISLVLRLHGARACKMRGVAEEGPGEAIHSGHDGIGLLKKDLVVLPSTGRGEHCSVAWLRTTTLARPRVAR